VEVAHQLSTPNGPYPKSQVARALGLARGTLYLRSKQAKKDKQVAVAIETYHERDDTLGHRKLAVLLSIGKNRVKRVMKKYGLVTRRKKKRYVYPGKASSIVPNLLREKQEKKMDRSNEKNVLSVVNETDLMECSNGGDVADGMLATQEVIFSDIFEVHLADRTKVRGCFALWKRTRHIVALAFDYSMRAELVVSTIDLVQFSVPGTIFHSDQGSQYGAAQTRAALLEKGFIRSMSRAGTPTDNGHAERFVGTFKLAVAERKRYQTLGQFLEAAEAWVDFYNHERPHEGLGNCSPDQFAADHGLPSAPSLSLR
jgi:putative transposase